jgi:hypothetical protein
MRIDKRVIRRLVAVAIAPNAAMACGGKAAVSASSTVPDATMLADVETVAMDAAGQGGQDAQGDTSLASEASKPIQDASDQLADSGCASTVDVDATTADACAPQWVQGNACTGGDVFFACGLPSQPLPNPSSSAYGICATYCGGSENFNGCRLVVDAGSGAAIVAFIPDAGTTPATVECYFNHTGRRPANLMAADGPETRHLGDVLGHMTYLESAAVVAFRELASHVERLGGPPSLVRRLRGAAAEEVRHAAAIGRMVTRWGGTIRRVQTARGGPCSLLGLAMENAREGCVRETWGAACAIAQSILASDRDFRTEMIAIARDELDHAALSWDLACWLESQLSDGERATVSAERRAAIKELEAELEHEAPRSWRAALGLPTPAQVQRIFDGLAEHVWLPAS